jgi:hypothetical protein
MVTLSGQLTADLISENEKVLKHFKEDKEIS